MEQHKVRQQYRVAELSLYGRVRRSGSFRVILFSRLPCARPTKDSGEDGGAGMYRRPNPVADRRRDPNWPFPVRAGTRGTE
jgi:hypothetical protein